MCRSILPVFLAALTVIVFSADAMAIYHPGQGRFMQRDPHGQQLGMSSGYISLDHIQPQLQYADGMNLYQYVGSRPTTFRDPSGLRGCKECGGVKKGRRQIARHGWKCCGDEDEGSWYKTRKKVCCDGKVYDKDPGWVVNPHGISFDMQQQYGINDGGQFRHCMAACMLARRYGIAGEGLIELWDQQFEYGNLRQGGYAQQDSSNDIAAEDIGIRLSRQDKCLPCHVKCKNIFGRGAPFYNHDFPLLQNDGPPRRPPTGQGSGCHGQGCFDAL